MSDKPSYEELEQKITELEESKLFFENLLDMLPEYVSYIDKDHAFKFANKTYKQFFNIDPQSMIGLHPREVLGDEAFEEVAPWHEAALSGLEQQYESTFRLPNGDPFYFHAHYLPHFDDGRIQGFLAVVQDITDHKQNEEILKTLHEELRENSEKLEMQNTALNVLLDNLNKQKERVAGDILSSFEKIVFPYIDKAQKSKNLKEILTYMEIIQRNIIQSLSSLERPATKAYRSFTPMEIQVADLIKAGKTSKEIAESLNISLRSVYFHRDNLRKKLDLKHTNKNLKSLLITLQ